MPVVRDPITALYSVNISWIVQSIVHDTETYTVWYSTDMMTFTDNVMIMGNTNLTAINEIFTVNISSLIPFTTYYYIILAANSVGSTSTFIMTFTTETGTPIR